MLSALVSRRQPRQHKPQNFPGYRNCRSAVHNQEGCSASQDRIFPRDQHTWTDILVTRLQASSQALLFLPPETALGLCFPLHEDLSVERMPHGLEHRLQRNSRSNDPKGSRQGRHTRSPEVSQICRYQTDSFRNLQEWARAFLLGRDTARRQSIRPFTNSKTKTQAAHPLDWTAHPAYLQRYAALGSLRTMLRKAQLSLSPNMPLRPFAGLLLHFFRFGNPQHLPHPGWVPLQKSFSCLASKA